MNWRKSTQSVCVGGLLIALLIWAANLNFSDSQSKVSSKDTTLKQLPTQLSEEEIQKQAQAIAVKVMSKNFLGSGIILKKQKSVYTVVTNAHVLRADKPPYRIQTFDGRIWQAKTLSAKSLQGNDLAILQFRPTNAVYAVASVGSFPKEGDEVFAAGFPFEEEKQEAKNFTFTTGKVSLVLPKALEGGYQIGYTNDIQKGMSGGPLLNRRGEVVGVNGMHAYPLWDAPSVFVDGKEADEKLHKMIVRLSWAVPIKTVVQVR
ncbi:serine protease [Brasilonema octagenarum UFV-E1]|uniref:Serine protease n=1 Tax=Brasilonema sennae CENA114 TaxID=415709 RepID=A0A856MJM3_9CYAN|nr:serine protease [Brasilonema sennae]QDL10374.1 serine protease [Brasilonema sennae CENA114]QDL16720.1 serine protease [Brasilonema octagenarum UFV-E1]